MVPQYWSKVPLYRYYTSTQMYRPIAIKTTIHQTLTICPLYMPLRYKLEKKNKVNRRIDQLPTQRL